MATYTTIQSITIETPVNQVNLSNITQEYTDLVLQINGGITGNGEPNILFNNDNGNNYSMLMTGAYGASGLYNAGAVSTNRSRIGGYVGYWNQASRAFCTVDINNYTNTTINKLYLSRDAIGGAETSLYGGTWLKQENIHTINIYLSNSAVFNAGTTFDLYGIKSGGVKAMGGQVYNDGTNFYHVFRSSGTFETTQAITADVLVIGGGGSGGFRGGGGGAGGVVYGTSRSIPAGVNYTVTVGAGGTPLGNNAGTDALSGTSSVFDNWTAIGGGYGANTYASKIAGTGGSGGGSSGNNAGAATTQTSPSGATGYGNAGGSGATSGQDGSGGGGGAGAVGGTATSTVAANGGAGLNTWSAWATATGTGASGFFAGGGAGSGNSTFGTGGSGGGGNGGNQDTGIAGTTNTGGGGGGGANSFLGGPGGSGIVIVRYPV
jgi:hypothetical protein